MVLIVYNNEFFFIAFGNDILIVKNNCLVNKITIPENVSQKYIVKDASIEQQSVATSGPNTPPMKLLQMATSSDNRLLALTTEDKHLILYKFDNNTDKDKNFMAPAELLSVRELSRTSTTLIFSPDSHNILITDKTGDCYQFDCIESDKPGYWILGHYSWIIDCIFTPDQKYIITCDRDEKIRITNYPETHKIEIYCMGHLEYVSKILFLPTHPNEILLSVSGDRTIKLWKYQEGLEIAEFPLAGSVIKSVCTKLNENSNHIANIIFDDDEKSKLIINEIIFNQKSTRYECKCIYEYDLSSNTDEKFTYFQSILFDKFNTLYISKLCSNNRILIETFKYSIETETYSMDDSTSTALNQLLMENLGNLNLSNENVRQLNEEFTLLFKKRFDNLKDYHEKKKRRIEEKSRKKTR